MQYAEYQNQISNDISKTITDLHCQPVLFLGAGISKRYFGAPNWEELLCELANECPLIDRDYAYYAQSSKSEPEIGSLFAEKFKEWAWTTGRNSFPKELFTADNPADSYFKYAIAEKIKNRTPVSLESVDKSFISEIEKIKNIKPHSILTTNYDNFIELLFPEYMKIIGQEALKGVPFSIGEIFKFHGCVSDISKIVITSEDYELFNKKKKFIAARLLSLFNEHPMLIVGYGVNDPNVRAILADIDEALAVPGSLIENIYFVEYNPDAEESGSLPTERLIQIEENRSVRVKSIVASSFSWIFEAFSSPETLQSVPASFMRAILARSYELVRTDIPRNKMEVNFDFLQGKLESKEEFAQLLGITTISDGSQNSAIFKYSITELGKELGGNSWHEADKIFKIIKRDTGKDLKSFDSKFHSKQKLNRTIFNLYSEDMLNLLKKVKLSNQCKVEWLD